jgi:hypothetical protein
MTTPALPNPGASGIEDHVQMSRRFIPLARQELAAGRRLQASEKGWGSVAHALKAIGLQRGWWHRAHPQMRAIAVHVGREFGQEEQFNNHLKNAEALHSNFYENTEWADQILININQAEQFLDLLDVVRNSPPRPYTVKNGSDRQRLGLLLGLNGEERPAIGGHSSVGFSRNHDDPDPDAFLVRNRPSGPGPSGGAEAAIPEPGADAGPPGETDTPPSPAPRGPWLALAPMGTGPAPGQRYRRKQPQEPAPSASSSDDEGQGLSLPLAIRTTDAPAEARATPGGARRRACGHSGQETPV